MAIKKPPRNRSAVVRRYTVFFLPDESGGYTAHIPALGIVTEGETLKEARVMAKDAIEGWIEVAQDLGKRIPDDIAFDQSRCPHESPAPCAESRSR
jgi:predicted RNase H-like HicB family nuclease